MTPSWLNEVVRAFGTQLHLAQFELTDRGVAGVNFENGLTLRFEHAQERLMVSVGVPLAENPVALKAALAAVHPSANLPLRVRAASLASTREIIFVTDLPERQVTVTSLEGAFRLLWQLAERLRRTFA